MMWFDSAEQPQIRTDVVASTADVINVEKTKCMRTGRSTDSWELKIYRLAVETVENFCY